MDAGRRGRDGHRRPEPDRRSRVAQVDVLAQLGFGRCSLQVAVRAGDDIDRRSPSSTAAGSPPPTPRSPAGFSPSRASQAEVTAIHGSVELAPRLDAADAIVDLVSTGDTLRANGLRPIATVLESRGGAAGPHRAGRGPAGVADELATVIRSVVAARGRRYRDAERPRRVARGIIDLLPGLDSPTVLPLAAEPACMRCTRWCRATGWSSCWGRCGRRRPLDPGAPDRQPDPVSALPSGPTWRTPPLPLAGGHARRHPAGTGST